MTEITGQPSSKCLTSPTNFHDKCVAVQGRISFNVYSDGYSLLLEAMEIAIWRFCQLDCGCHSDLTIHLPVLCIRFQVNCIGNFSLTKDLLSFGSITSVIYKLILRSYNHQSKIVYQFFSDAFRAFIMKTVVRIIIHILFTRIRQGQGQSYGKCQNRYHKNLAHHR